MDSLNESQKAIKQVLEDIINKTGTPTTSISDDLLQLHNSIKSKNGGI